MWMICLSPKTGGNSLPMKRWLVPCVIYAPCNRKVGIAWELIAFFVERQPGEPSPGPKEQLGEVPSHNRHILVRVISCCVPELLTGFIFFINSDVQQKQNCCNDPDWCPQQEDGAARSNRRRSRNSTSKWRLKGWRVSTMVWTFYVQQAPAMSQLLRTPLSRMQRQLKESAWECVYR